MKTGVSQFCFDCPQCTFDNQGLEFCERVLRHCCVQLTHDRLLVLRKTLKIIAPCPQRCLIFLALMSDRRLTDTHAAREHMQCKPTQANKLKRGSSVFCNQTSSLAGSAAPSQLVARFGRFRTENTNVREIVFTNDSHPMTSPGTNMDISERARVSSTLSKLASEMKGAVTL